LHTAGNLRKHAGSIEPTGTSEKRGEAGEEPHILTAQILNITAGKWL